MAGQPHGPVLGYTHPQPPSISRWTQSQSPRRDLPKPPKQSRQSQGYHRQDIRSWTAAHGFPFQPIRATLRRQLGQLCSCKQPCMECQPGGPTRCAHESVALDHRLRSQPKSRHPSEPHRWSCFSHNPRARGNQHAHSGVSLFHTQHALLKSWYHGLFLLALHQSRHRL